MIDSFIGDLRFGFRTLVKRPGFTLVVLVTLAVGIGATTAVFSVVESVLLRPLPYPEAGDLVITRNSNLDEGNTFNMTYPDYRMWKREQVFENLAIFGNFDADVTGDGEPVRVRVSEVGEGYFPTVRIGSILGRTFQKEDHAPGADRIVLLGEHFWESRYASDPEVLGRTIRVRDVPHSVAGVVPAAASAPARVDVWLPMQEDPAAHYWDDWDNGAFTAIARLRDGETLDSTNARLAVLAARVAEEHPAQRSGRTSLVLPLIRFITGADLHRALWILLGTVSLVLLIGCVNIANLNLSLATHRSREFAVRSALGAGRIRLIRQQLTEGLLLAVGGGLLGVLISYWLVDSMVAMAPRDIPRIQDVGLNESVLLFALVISLASAWIFSLVPAFRATARSSANTLGEGILRAPGGRRERRRRHALVAIELALSLILLAGAGYAMQSLRNLTRVEPGFDQGRLLHVPLSLSRVRYEPGAPVMAFYERLLEEVSTLPGVESATVRSAMPIGGGGYYMFRFYLPEGRPEPPEGTEIGGPWTVVGRDHFRTMGIPLLQGRDFDSRDDADGVPVIIVNQRFARAMFGDENPIGKRVRSWRDEDIYREIVGVAGNVRYYGLEDTIRPCVYVPHDQNQWRVLGLVIRTTGSPKGLIPAVRDAMVGLDPDLVVSKISTMDEVFTANLAAPRFLRTLLVAYAVIALLLSAIGIYGVLSYLISLRTREIGVRIAVGARQGDILRMILGDTSWPLGIGILAGVGSVLALGRILQALLFEVSVFEPLVMLEVCAILVGISLLAISIPAVRAARVDPAEVLRIE
jgi:putative ABC transport system permease protein